MSFGHIGSIGKRVIVLGGGNTAMDCCRTSRRLGGEEVTVVVRSGFEEMKASPWEKEDAMHEGIPILNFLVPTLAFYPRGRPVDGREFRDGAAGVRRPGPSAAFVPTGDPGLPGASPAATSWWRGRPGELLPVDPNAISVLEFDKWDMPVVSEVSFISTNPKVFFGGDAAFGPKNIIWAVAHGHDAAISIHRFCHGEDPNVRPDPGVTLVSQKMGIHEWSYDNDVSLEQRNRVPLREMKEALRNVKLEVELGFDEAVGFREAERCLNCDIQTVFTDALCIECDACVDICPMDCITFTDNGCEPDLRARLTAPALNLTQDLYVSSSLKTGQIAVK